MAFEDQWPVIEAFIADRAVGPDPVLVDTIREMVRIGEVPALAGPGLGFPGPGEEVAGPGLGFPGRQPTTFSENPETDLPILTGPGLGFPADDPHVLTFETWEDARSAHAAMSELAEQQLLEP